MNDLYKNLALVLAHSQVWFSRVEWECVQDARMGDDPPAREAGESTASTVRGLTENLPALLMALQKQILPNEQASLAAQQQIAPQQAALDQLLYEQFGPQQAATAGKIAEQQARSDTDLVNGPGRALVEAAQQLQQQVDPEFYANRAVTSKAYGDLVAGQNPNELSGAEIANVERTQNRSNTATGVAGSGSATAATRNALGFDDRLQMKRKQLGDTLAQFSGIQAGSRSGIDPFQIATGRSSQAAAAPSPTQFGARNVGQNVYGTGNQLLGASAANVQQQNDINSQRRDSLDRVTGLLGSLPT